MLCDSLDESGVWGRMETHLHMAEYLCCSLETITTLLISYTPIQNKKLKKKSQREAGGVADQVILDPAWAQLLGWLSPCSWSGRHTPPRPLPYW